MGLFRAVVRWACFARQAVPFEMLEQQVFAETNCIFYRYTHNSITVATLNLALEDKDTLSILLIYVHGEAGGDQPEYLKKVPSYRGKGIGNKLLKLACEEAAGQRRHRVIIRNPHPFGERSIDVRKWYYRHCFKPNQNGDLEANVEEILATLPE